jgi:hypothetical protein
MYAELKQHYVSRGKTVYLVKPLPRIDINEKLREETMRGLAGVFGSHYIKTKITAKHLGSDGVHLNGEGQCLLVGTLTRLVRKL